MAELNAYVLLEAIPVRIGQLGLGPDLGPGRLFRIFRLMADRVQIHSKGATAMALTVMPKQQEQADIVRLDKVLRLDTHPEIVGPGGERIALPDSIYQVLRDVVRLLASNTPFTLAPADHELTTQQAANLLNVSRPHLVKLLESGEVPFHRVGSHRRVRLQDLMRYRQKRDETRAQALDELAALSDELDLYE